MAASGRVVPVALLLLLAAGCGGVRTRAQDPKGAPALQPTAEDRDAGLVGVAPGFDPKAYRVLVVQRFTIAEGQIKGRDDRELAVEMSLFVQSELVDRFRASKLFDRVIDAGDKPWSARAGEPTLVVEGTITELAGGSEWLRLLMFGPGRTRAQMETRFVDVGSQRVVLVTADRRIATMATSASIDYGGESDDLLKQSFEKMARDLVKFLTRLAAGEPKPK